MRQRQRRRRQGRRFGPAAQPEVPPGSADWTFGSPLPTANEVAASEPPIAVAKKEVDIGCDGRLVTDGNDGEETMAPGQIGIETPAGGLEARRQLAHLRRLTSRRFSGGAGRRPLQARVRRRPPRGSRILRLHRRSASELTFTARSFHWSPFKMN